MTRRVVSLWLPRLATDRIRRREAALPAAGPLVTVTEAAGRFLVAAVDAVAAASGLAPGISLADARALVPEVATRPADPVGEAAALSRLAEWCGRYTPWTAAEGTHGVWLDVTGCAHLFGGPDLLDGESALLEDLLGRLHGFGLAARAALAETPGAAWALARFGGEEKAVVPEGDVRAALAPLPVASLRLGAATADGLSRLGLRRVGDLYPMARAPLAARFGGEVALRLDQALGRVAEPVSPRRVVPPYRVRLSFPEPIGDPRDIARGLERLVERLAERLAADGLGCRRVEFALYRADGSVQRSAVGAARATRDPAHLVRLFAERLDELDPGFGIETLALSAVATEPLAPAQADIGGEGGNDDLAPLLDRLGNRLGFARVQRLSPVESHLPERAQRAVAVTTPSPSLLPLASPPGQGERGYLDGAAPKPLSRLREREGPSYSQSGWEGEGASRPLRLLRWPEPVTSVTVEGVAPVGAPTAFRWRRRDHRLRHAVGPERIEPEWWREDQGWAGGARDYWRVEDEDGRRLWLYREGGKEESRWFVHGVFG